MTNNVENNVRVSTLYPDDSPTMEEVIEGKDAANLLYPKETGAPVNPYALDPESRESLMYSSTDTLNLVSLDLSKVSTPENETEFRQKLGFIGDAIGATPDDIRHLIEISADMDAGKEIPGDEFQNHIDAWDQQYGDQLQNKMDDAINLLESLPALKEWVNQSQAKDNPKFLQLLLRLSETSKSQHRLKTYKAGEKS